MGDSKQAHQVGAESPLIHPAEALQGPLGSGCWDSAEKLYSSDLVTKLWTTKPTDIIFPSLKCIGDIGFLEVQCGSQKSRNPFWGLERASQSIAGLLLPCSESEMH